MKDVIQTARLTLVPLTKDHAEAFHAVWSDPDATQWSLHGRNETLSDSEQWMTGVLRTPANDDRRSWAVYVSDALNPDQCIGIVTLRPPDAPAKNEVACKKTWELGYLYRPEHWGNGYATESCSAAIESLKKDLDVYPDRQKVRLVASVGHGNNGSLKVCQKLGFAIVEARTFGGSKRFLGGEWRENAVFMLEREL